MYTSACRRGIAFSSTSDDLDHDMVLGKGKEPIVGKHVGEAIIIDKREGKTHEKLGTSGVPPNAIATGEFDSGSDFESAKHRGLLSRNRPEVKGVGGTRSSSGGSSVGGVDERGARSKVIPPDEAVWDSKEWTESEGLTGEGVDVATGVQGSRTSEDGNEHNGRIRGIEAMDSLVKAVGDQHDSHDDYEWMGE